jgi:predicted TIM-barrel fold metal-dependent hydrolase
MQGFYPNDRMAYDLYEAIAETGKPALFHTGQTGVGSGMRGGNGMRLKYSNPMYIDDLAVDFPDMPIILAHPSFPWQEEALASRPTSPTSISTSPAGRRNTFRRSSCAMPTRF